MSDDRPTTTTELERRLSQGLARLAERATTSPDALDAILSASSDPPQQAGEDRASTVTEEPRANVVTLTPRVPATPKLTKPWQTKAFAPILALAAGVMIAALVLGPLARRPTINSPSVTPQNSGIGSPTQDSMSAPVVGGPGVTRVAWIHNGTLELGSSSGHGPAKAIGPGLNPEWSADGQWLSYLVAEPNSSYQVRVVRSNGTDDHEVLGAPGFAAFLWSPTANQIAAVPLTAAGNSAGLVIVATTGAPREILAPSTPVDSMIWSQDGTQLAYSGPEGVFRVPLSGGNSVSVPYTPPAGATVIMAGWWPGDQGLLLWVDRAGAVEANGLPLVAVPLAGSLAGSGRGGAPHTLATTQVFLSWLAWTPDGSELALVVGGGPEPNTNKSIKLCAPPGSSGHSSWSCHRIPQPTGAVSLDPAWSPDGTQISFVRASASPDPSTFYVSRTLYVADSDGSHTHQVAVTGGTSGAVLPVWSVNGSDIGYSTGSEIALTPAGGGAPRTLASGLSGSYQGSSVGTDSYGKQPWGGSAAWDTGPGSAADGDT